MPDNFNYGVEQFADLSIFRYHVSGFENLHLGHKKLIYYLSQAALEGRDIFFDQNFKYNLAVRRTLEAIYENYTGDKESEEFKQLVVYLKCVWFSNGIHHYYSKQKFVPKFSKKFFTESIKSIDPQLLPLKENQTVNEFLNMITPIIFDSNLYSKQILQETNGDDPIKESCTNLYDLNISENEVIKFYDKMVEQADTTPVSYGINTQLSKEKGELIEKIWKLDGMYSKSIEKIIYWLELAKNVAENGRQKSTIEFLINFYKTGNLKTLDYYYIFWVQDTDSHVDFLNGFIEPYNDPLGIKGSWEAMVEFKNDELTKRSEIIAQNAQWFEDNSSFDDKYKTVVPKSISSKIVTAAFFAGDCYPMAPIGMNLPNSNWIRKHYGSKSVTFENIMTANEKTREGNGLFDEFVWSKKEMDLINKYSSQTSILRTDLHELGLGSRRLAHGISQNSLGIYRNNIEDTYANLFGLYFIADPKMIEWGLLNSQDAYKNEYYKIMVNGILVQLSKMEPNTKIEESNMRSTALISHWILEKGSQEKIVELVKKDGKTYVVINDYEKMRSLIKKLFLKIQQIKYEGDFEGAKKLIETYAIQVDPVLHEEVLNRYKKLNVPQYKGFMNPVYDLVKNSNGDITDVKVSYDEGFAEQMMRYSKYYSPLPTYN